MNQAPPAYASCTYTVFTASPAPAGGPPRPGAVQPQTVSGQVARVLLSGASLVAVVLGITLPGPAGSGWDAFLAWSIGAAASALAVLAGAATDHRRWSWTMQLCGTGGLLTFWLIAGRPIAVSNVGFLLTAGVLLAVLVTLRNPSRPPWRVVLGCLGPPRR